MSLSPWTMDGSFWWGCKYPHEDWCEERGNNSKNGSFAWSKGDHPQDTPNRNTIEEFTEEIDAAWFVRQNNFLYLQMKILCLCLALMNPLLSVASLSSSFVTTAVSLPHWVVKSDRLSLDEDHLREDYYCEAFAFSRHMRRSWSQRRQLRRQETQE